MTLKRKGEVGLEEIYAAAPKGVTYTIVRPGGLTDGAVIGPAGGGRGARGENLHSRSFFFTALHLYKSRRHSLRRIV